MVGWHDFISCYLLGFKVKIKLSKSDDVIIPFMIKILSLFSIDLMKETEIVNGRAKDYDMVIATGSNNTNRYFEYYFGKTPHLFRKNRTSVAIIDNQTTENDLNKLSKDVFDYFGLGLSANIYMAATDNIRVFNSGQWPTYGTSYGAFSGMLIG